MDLVETAPPLYSAEPPHPCDLLTR